MTTCTTVRCSFKDGRYLLLDWGDACVTHPYFTLAVTLDGVHRLGR